MIRLIQSLLGYREPQAMYRSPQARFAPEPPPGFVRRSDPNFYFLARKF
jgi:hypothetical protein